MGAETWLGLTVGLIVGWVALSALVGWAAGERGRSVFGWFCVSLVFSPLLAILVLIATPRVPRTCIGPLVPRTSTGPVVPRTSTGEDAPQWPDLRETSFYGANLWAANFTNAHELTRDQILSCLDWRGAQLPDHLRDLELPKNAPATAMDHLGRTWKPWVKPR